MNPLRVQIWSGSVGGHNQIAQAIQSTLQEIQADIQVDIVDTLGTDALYDRGTKLAHLYDRAVCDTPWLWEFTWKLMNTKPGVYLMRLLGTSLTQKKKIKKLSDAAPDVVVRVIADYGQVKLAKQYARNPFPVITVVTDPIDIHRGWLTQDDDLVIVATDDAYETCTRYGVPPEKIEVIGFPIRAALFCTPNGFRKARTIETALKILMIGGSSGAGRIYDDAIALVNAGMNLELTVVCGHNVQMYEKLCHVAAGDTGTVQLHVTGYTTQIPELMRAADVLITKAGPGTLYEAVASYLPVVINSHIPGQENDNAAFFAAAGVALISTTPQETVQRIRTLYDDRARLYQMQNPALAVQTCQAVYKISQRILSAAGRRQPQEIGLVDHLVSQ